MPITMLLMYTFKKEARDIAQNCQLQDASTSLNPQKMTANAETNNVENKS